MNSNALILRVLLAAFLATSASAATVVVSPNGPIQSIQAGITNAAAGDTVKILPGTYRESSITIPSGKTGLILQGAGNVRVDATPTLGTPWSKGFIVASDDVTIRGILIFGAKDTEALSGIGGVAFDAIGNNLRIDDCEVLGCDYAGVISSSSKITIQDSRFSKTWRPLQLFVAEVVVSRCTFESTYGNAIDIQGTNVEVEKSKFHNIHGYVEKDMSASYGTAIRIDATNVRVDGCTIELARTGIAIDSETLNLTKCKVSNVIEHGIRVGCTTVLADKIEVDSVLESDAISIIASGNAIVTNCRVKNFAYAGIYLTSGGVSIVSGNQATDGGLWSVGIDCIGVNLTLTDNNVSHCRDGINVFAESCEISKNVCSDNFCDGIDSRANNATITQNKCQRNLGEGIENSGNGVTMTNNTCAKNRIDIANTGTISSFTGNKFKTGGSSAAPESN